MNNLKIKRFNWSLSLPSTWNELTEYQYEAILNVLGSGKTQAGKELSILLIILNIKWYQFGKRWQATRLWPEELVTMRNYLIKWCFKPIEVTDWVYKSLIYPSHEMGLSNWQFGQFCYADTYYIKWTQTNDHVYLNKLMVCIFSADMKSIDGSFMFKSELIDSRAKEYQKIKIGIKAGVAYTYATLRRGLSVTFPNTFPKTESKSSNSDGFGWAAVLDEISGTKFGNDRETELANLSKVLIHLERTQIKAMNK